VKIGFNLGGDVTGKPVTPRMAVEQAAAADLQGYATAWTVNLTRAGEGLSVLAAAAMVTERIRLGVGVVPTHPRHPSALAQQAMTVQALSGGRVTLGVGVSHRPVMTGMLGLDYGTPLHHLREYLSVLVPLVRTGAVSFEGESYRVDLSIDIKGTSPVPVLVGVLSPASARVAGELADGIITWLAGPRTIGGLLAPAVREGGRGAQVVAGVPVVVTDRVAEVTAAANRVFARYATMENYQRLYDREGVSGPADLAIIGPEHVVEDRLAELAAAGVDELWPVVFEVGDDHGEAERTAALLTRSAGAA